MFHFIVAVLATTAAPSPGSAPRDSTPRQAIVRQFEAIEVSGRRFDDLGSVQGVHELGEPALRALPATRFLDAVALMPGVVATGEDLHVQGGRTGELAVTIAGVPLTDPQSGRPFEIPLFAVRRSELLTGAVDADRNGALAGDLDVATGWAGARREGRLRWSSDGRASGSSDVAQFGGSTPLGIGGLGISGAGEVRLDDLGLINRRSRGRTHVLGRSFGWREDNHLLGWAKLASVAHPRRAALEVLGGRVIRQPYDPMWGIDGWVTFHDFAFGDPPGTQPIYVTPYPLAANSFRYRAADHRVMVEERNLAVIASGSAGSRIPVHASLAWLRTSSLTSVGLRHDTTYVVPQDRPVFGPYGWAGVAPFYVYAGDDPWFRDASAERWFGRVDASAAPARQQHLQVGAGASWDHVKLFEVDDGAPVTPYVDVSRRYDASAPGGFAYVQHRWATAGFVANEGLRLQAFTPGSSVPGAKVRWSLSPRLGLAYPVSVRDAFSFAYARIAQDPPRDFLYEDRTRAYDRRPLGNGALEPAEVVLWQVAVRHVLDPEWSLQISVFLRDVYGEPGVRDHPVPGTTTNLRYESDDDAHSDGLTFEVTRERPDGARLHAAYTFMNARGNASNAYGIAYGKAYGARTQSTAEHPLDWDIEHALGLDGAHRIGNRVRVSWSTRLATGRPWTPIESDSAVSVLPPQYANQDHVNSRRLRWSESTQLDVRVELPRARGVVALLSVSNLFDHRGDLLAAVDGFPNPRINTAYDEYEAYRTATGKGGGGYWNGVGAARGWVPAYDPRLGQRARQVRLGISLGE